MHIIPYDEVDPDEFFKWLKNQRSKKVDPAYENMWDNNWANCPNTLPYILEKTNRFRSDNGKFFILLDGSNIIGCSGVYISNIDFNIAIAGHRTWISEGHRNQVLLKDYFFPAQKKWAIEQDCKQIVLTFNEYNKNLIQIFKRTRLSENANRVKHRKPHELFYNGVNEILYPVDIHNTKQWIIYESLDKDFFYDWQQIKWTE